MAHQHFFTNKTYEYRKIVLRGVYRDYEENRKVIIYACACGKKEKYYRYPWEDMIVESYDHKTL